MKSCLFSLAAVVWAATGPLSASVVTIDFDGFTPGDGLAEINATTSALGVLFDAGPFGGVTVIDQGGGDLALRVSRGAGFGEAELLANLTVAADSVSVRFERQSGPTIEIGILDFYNQPQSASALNFGEFEYQASGTDVPETISSSWIPDSGQAPPSRIRSVVMSQSFGSGNPDLFWVVDDVMVDLVPEPLTGVLVWLGVSPLVLIRRRK